MNRAYEFPIEKAIECADIAANKHRLAQTVFKNSDTAGWAHTHPFAVVLGRSEVHLTVLPDDYFY